MCMYNKVYIVNDVPHILFYSSIEYTNEIMAVIF